MSNSPAEGILLAVCIVLSAGIGYFTGENYGRVSERAKVVESQEYVETLRTLDISKEKIKELKKRLDQ